MSEAVHDPVPVGSEPSAKLTTLAFRNPAARRLRFVKAYWTTFVVINSYLTLGFFGRVLGRSWYDARLPRVHAVNAKRIEATIVELQGLFIKVGQLISIMTNFLPEEFRKPLESLQDQVPPRPIDEITRRVVHELGAPPGEVFRTFDETPLASASLGQVHRATLEDGTEVVIKVQHADIDAIVQIDLKTVWRIMVIVGWFVPLQGLDVIYRQIREMIEAELDFVREAAFMERIGKNLESFEDVAVPRLYPEFCTGRVLTSAYWDGTKVSDLESLDAWGIDRDELANRLIRTYCKMVFEDGLYHADPHPGNVLVTRDGTIVLLDFGAVAELSPAMKQGIPDLLEAVLKRDSGAIYRAFRTMGFIARGAEAEAASERIIEYVHRRFQDQVQLESLNLKDIKIDPQMGIENLLDFQRQDFSIRELTSAFQVPKDWVLLERTVLLMGGVCTHLAPDMNPISVIRPYLEEFIFGEDRDFATLMVNAVKDSAMNALTVPDDIRKYLQKAMRGELEMRFRGFGRSANLLYSLGHQVIYSLFSITSAVAAFLFYDRGDLTVAYLAAGFAAFFVLAIFGSMVLARKWRRRSG